MAKAFPIRLERLPSVRMALLAGFAMVFALWLGWGYQLLGGLAEIERTAARVQESYERGETILVQIRTTVLLGSIYLRDALIDGASLNRDYYREEIERLREESDRLLDRYVPQVASPVERAEWERLRAELVEYWASRDVVSGGVLTAYESTALLRARIVPRRDAVLAILDQLGTLQSGASRQARGEMLRLHDDVRTRLVYMGVGTLVAAFFVAVMASRHVSRLQREVERQRLSETENRQDLERLSARLVDAQEQERRSLARELHDAVGQALTAVKMDIGIALRATSTPRARTALEDAREIMETTIKGVRDLSQLLHPSTLDDFGLPATLGAYLHSFSQRTGILADLREQLSRRLAPAVEVCVYRIVQEGLNNVARHSGATRCTVSLESVDNTLRLSIEDDGRGLPSPLVAGGLGLIGMRERAQALGGTLTVEGPPGLGTRLMVVLPLREPVEREPAPLDRLAG
jgi:signal transduction histidine kinase